MKKKQIKHESYQDAESIKLYLQQIINGLDQGKISLSSGDDSLVLEPYGLLEFTINVNQSKSKQQLRLKIEWQPKEASSSPVPDDELTIV